MDMVATEWDAHWFCTGQCRQVFIDMELASKAVDESTLLRHLACNIHTFTGSPRFCSRAGGRRQKKARTSVAAVAIIKSIKAGLLVQLCSFGHQEHLARLGKRKPPH
jgi:hypothetical protein